jgi:hypothetical protein
MVEFDVSQNGRCRRRLDKQAQSQARQTGKGFFQAKFHSKTPQAEINLR